MYLSWTIFSIPIPELTYGQILQRNNQYAIQITRDPAEKATRAAWKKTADEIAAKLKAGGLSEAEADKLKAQHGHRHPAGHRPRGQRRRPARPVPDVCRQVWACGTSWP